MTDYETRSSLATPPDGFAESPPAESPPPMAPPPMAQPPVSWAPVPSTQPGPMPGLRYAGFWVRMLAFLIDGVIVLVLASLIASAFGPSEAGLALVLVLWIAVPVIYFPFCWTLLNGQTPGMAAFNMRILRADTGEKIGLGRAIVRAFGLLIAFALYGLGFLWVAFDGRKQGWHDKLAGTVVVRPT